MKLEQLPLGTVLNYWVLFKEVAKSQYAHVVFLAKIPYAGSGTDGYTAENKQQPNV